MSWFRNIILLALIASAGAYARQITGKTNNGSFAPPPPVLHLEVELTVPSGGDTLVAGEKASIRIVASNAGQCSSAEGVVAKITSATDLLGVTFSSVSEVGSIGPGASKSAIAKVEAMKDAKSQAVTLLVQAMTTSGVKSEPQSVRFFVREELIVPVLSVAVDFSEPSGNGFLDAGEAADLTASIVNSGKATAKGAIIAPSNPMMFAGLSMVPPAETAEIAPGETKTVLFKIWAAEDITSQTINLKVSVSGSNFSPIDSKTISISTKARPIQANLAPPDIELTEPVSLTILGARSSSPHPSGINEAPSTAMKGIAKDSSASVQMDVNGGEATVPPKVGGEEDLVVNTGELKIRGIAKGSSAIAVVKVQGKEALLKPVVGGYEFVARALLQFGSNRIDVVATDIHRNFTTLNLKVRREVPIAKTEEAIPQVEAFRGHQVWAAVIGISRYRNSKLPQLRYADRDASAFCQFLTSPLDSGGMGVSPANVRKLINKDATRMNIVASVTDFMKRAIEEDVVIIYFAGHGYPDPDRPEVPYLLAYDSDLSQLAGTAVEMKVIQDAIRFYIKAKKVIVFVDACHSAGVSGDVTMRGEITNDVVNKFIEEIAKAGSSVLTFSASELKELSQESPRWGGGHGVFTYFLLEGLKGKAKVDSDPIVRLGELVDYVTENVRRETKSGQHPSASQSQWDRSLPMSISRELVK
jgi:hypothetical protein